MQTSPRLQSCRAGVSQMAVEICGYMTPSYRPMMGAATNAKEGGRLA